MTNKLWPHSISMWRHFYDHERTSDELTASMTRWQERWNWDFLKNNPAACYHALAWNVDYQFYPDPLKEPTLRKPMIVTEQDIDRVRDIDVKQGELGEQLKVVRNLRAHFGPDLPILETVFSPIEIAHRFFTGREALTEMRKKSPAKIHQLLEVITNTFRRFCLESINAGADGIFFATKWASKDLMSWNEYQEFGTRYELPILNALKQKGAQIVLHVCGARTYLQQMLDYPVDAFSYDFYADEALQPATILESTNAHVIGGIDPEQLKQDPKAAAERCSKYRNLDRWIAGPSCVVLPDTTDQAIEICNAGLRRILE
jgi:uroporphyrinogen decarboxylase